MRDQRLGETPPSVISLKLTMRPPAVETGPQRVAIITFDDRPNAEKPPRLPRPGAGRTVVPAPPSFLLTT
jgi:hypothetical protein